MIFPSSPSNWGASPRPINTHHSEVLERPGGLDVLEGLLQVLQLSVDLGLGLLSALDGLSLVGLDGLDLAANVVLLDLEAVELLLNVVDDGGVLENGAVVGEVDLLGLLGQELDLAARVVVALLEGLQGLGGGATEAEFGAQVGPVDLRGGAALEWVLVSAASSSEKVGRGSSPRAPGSWASQSAHRPAQGIRNRLYVQ